MRGEKRCISKIHLWGPQICIMGYRILTGQAISRLGTVLRVPVNVQEGNCLKYKKYSFQGLTICLDKRRETHVSLSQSIQKCQIGIMKRKYLRLYRMQLRFQIQQDTIEEILSNIDFSIIYLWIFWKESNKYYITWLNVGLLCNLEQRSPCRHAPILK